VNPSTKSLEVTPDVIGEVIAPVLTLPAFGRAEMIAARRRGENVDQRVADFWRRYDEAWKEMQKRADEAAERLNVAPYVIWQAVMNSYVLAAALERHTPPSRWGACFPRVIKSDERVRTPFEPVLARRTPRPRARQHRHVRRRKLATSRSSGSDPSNPEPPGGGQPRRRHSKPRLIGEILADYIEQVLAHAHDHLVARRIGREVFDDERPS
jgi:hypothetical protein